VQDSSSDTKKIDPDKEQEAKERQELVSSPLQKAATILLFALIVFLVVDAYFNDWSFVRSLASLNTLELADTTGGSWDLLARKDFQLVRIKNGQNILTADSLILFDKPYRDAGYYRLYFRNSDSSSARLQRMYQALLSTDSTQVIRHTVDDAQRAYRNLQKILRINRPEFVDSSARTVPDSMPAVAKSDLALGTGMETSIVVKRLVSNPQVLVGVGIGIAASAGIDLLKGDVFVALAKDDVYRLDSLKVGTRVGRWEGSPIDILWAFARQDSLSGQQAKNRPSQAQ
jgi:hypothetical protein